MKLNAVLVIALILCIPHVLFAQPSIVDFDDVLNEGYPNTGGFVGHDITALTLSTPNATVTANDYLVVLATQIGDNEEGATASIATNGASGITARWVTVSNFSNIRVNGLGSLFAWVAHVMESQSNGVSVAITPSVATDIDAIIFEVTGTNQAIDTIGGKVKHFTGTGTTFTTPSLTLSNGIPGMIVAFTATRSAEGNPAVLTAGYSDLNWLGIGGDYPASGDPAAYGVASENGSYSVTFAESVPGDALAGIFWVK